MKKKVNNPENQFGIDIQMKQFWSQEVRLDSVEGRREVNKEHANIGTSLIQVKKGIVENG